MWLPGSGRPGGGTRQHSSEIWPVLGGKRVFVSGAFDVVPLSGLADAALDLSFLS